MGHRTRPKPKAIKTSVWKRPAIIIAIIVGVQAVIVAILNPDLVGKIIDYMETSANSGAKSGNEMSTLESPTPLVTETFLPTASPIEAVLPGQDWAGNCIDSTIWKSSLAGNAGGTQTQCHQLSEWGINAQQGRLIFASNQYSQTTAYEYGILTPWHDWKEVDFTVKAERQENSEIWVGFFEGDTPNSTGIIFIIQPEDEIDIRAMPNETKIVDNVDLKYAGGVFHPRIIFEGGKIAVWVDGQGIISNWPVNFTIRNMFIGYRALPSMNLNAAVFDLKFIP